MAVEQEKIHIYLKSTFAVLSFAQKRCPFKVAASGVYIRFVIGSDVFVFYLNISAGF